jgi:Na+/H+ antiporter NhaC
VVFALALATRRTVEPIVVGSLLGFAMLEDWASPLGAALGAFDQFASSLLAVMGDETIRWLLLVCGLFGAIIHIQTATGGAQAVGELLARRVRGPRGVMLCTFGLGLVVFVDDYLNALAVGSTMRRLADRYGVSRAMLAYIVDSTAAPVCVLVPASTWAFYVGGLLEAEGVAASGEGLAAYVSMLPMFVYAWAAVLLVLVVCATGWPLMGPMRAEEQRAREGYERRGREAPSGMPPRGTPDAEAPFTGNVWVAAATFIAPLLALAVVVFGLPASDANRVLKGVMAGIAVAVVLARMATPLRFGEISELALEGVGKMVPALAIVVMSFVLKDVNERLGLTPYLIETFRPWLTQAMLPAAAFVGLSLVTFATGSYWGTYAVAMPIVVPLAREVGADIPLTVGAVVSAGAFGSHACFYGDATVLSSASCGLPNMTHAITQIPYAALAAFGTTIVYLVWGVIS